MMIIKFDFHNEYIVMIKICIIATHLRKFMPSRRLSGNFKSSDYDHPNFVYMATTHLYAWSKTSLSSQACRWEHDFCVRVRKTDATRKTDLVFFSSHTDLSDSMFTLPRTYRALLYLYPPKHVYNIYKPARTYTIEKWLKVGFLRGK